MRRMRSESWTFIWQPKVRMHAVLVASETPGPLATGWGFLVRFIRVSLILLLRLVDSRSHGDLPWPGVELELPQLKVACLRRLPKYIRDAAYFLDSKFKYLPIAYRSSTLP